MIKTTKLCFALAILFTASQVSAISSYPTWYSDASIGDSIEYNGLEWLTWDKTTNMSITDALSVYSNDGWRLASNTEVCTMFDSLFALNDVGFNPIENVTQSTWDPATHENASYFFDYFGLTDYACEPTGYYGCQAWSAALFGDDSDSDGLYNLASFNYTKWDDNSDSTAVLESDQYLSTEKFSTLENSDFRSYGTGVALVRSLGGGGHGTVTRVPEINSKGVTLAFTLLFALLLLVRECKAGKAVSA